MRFPIYDEFLLSTELTFAWRTRAGATAGAACRMSTRPSLGKASSSACLASSPRPSKCRQRVLTCMSSCKGGDGWLVETSLVQVTGYFLVKAFDAGRPPVRYDILLDPRGAHDILYRCKQAPVHSLESKHRTHASTQALHREAEFQGFSSNSVLRLQCSARLSNNQDRGLCCHL